MKELIKELKELKTRLLNLAPKQSYMLHYPDGSEIPDTHGFVPYKINEGLYDNNGNCYRIKDIWISVSHHDADFDDHYIHVFLEDTTESPHHYKNN